MEAPCAVCARLSKSPGSASTYQYISNTKRSVPEISEEPRPLSKECGTVSAQTLVINGCQWALIRVLSDPDNDRTVCPLRTEIYTIPRTTPASLCLPYFHHEFSHAALSISSWQNTMRGPPSQSRDNGVANEMTCGPLEERISAMRSSASSLLSPIGAARRVWEGRHS